MCKSYMFQGFFPDHFNECQSLGFTVKKLGSKAHVQCYIKMGKNSIEFIVGRLHEHCLVHITREVCKAK